MSQAFSLIVFPVKDVEKAKAVYTKLLDSEPYMENPYYVGFRVGDQEIGLDPNGHKKGMTGPLGYYGVADIRKSVQSLVGAGARVTQDVKDVGGGRLTAWLADVDDNPIGLLQLP